MVTEIEFPRKLLLAYNAMCKPLCRKLGLPQTAFDILMFLGNNPEYRTARDIVEVRNIKANLVSVNVDRLVQEDIWSAGVWRWIVGRRSSSVQKRRNH